MKKIYSKCLMALALAIFAISGSLYAQAPDDFTTIVIDWEDDGIFPGEVEFELVDGDGNEYFCGEGFNGVNNQLPATVVVPNDTELFFNMSDTFGDGWDASLTVSANEDASAYTNGCAPNMALLATGVGAEFTTGAGGTVACDGVASTDFLAATSIVVECVECLVTCPADIIVDSDPGLCGAFVMIDTAMVSDACTDTIIGDCVDFEGMADLLFDGTGDLNGLIDSDVEITGVPTMLDPLITSIDVEICVSGDFGTQEDELAEILDEAGTVLDTIGDELAGDCLEYCTTVTIANADYNTFAADGILTFTIAANADVNPICASNTVTAVACIPEVIILSDLLFNDFTGTADASGEYPVGTTTVTYFSQGLSGTMEMCSFTVTVNDVEAPVIECPDDIVVNLDAGECGAVVTYAVPLSDNCPAAPVTFAGPFCDVVGNPSGGSALACAPFAQNSIIQFVDGFPDGELTSVFFSQETFGGSPTATVNIYAASADVPFTGGGFTPLGSQTYTADPADDGTVVEVVFDTPPVVTSTGVWVEIFTPGTTLNSRIVNTPAACDGATATGELTFIVAPACGLGTPGTFASIGFSLDAAISVAVLSATEDGVPDPSNELASGDLFPIGTTVLTYGGTDAAGNEVECTFSVTVNEFPEDLQTSTLTCNGDVNISVDETCSITFFADQFLEGGPYGCYENYAMEIYPFGSGPAVPVAEGQSIEFSSLLGTHEIRVYDANNPDNFCWGFFTAEDKLAPSIECEDITLLCTDPTDVGASTPGGEVPYLGTPGLPVNNLLDPAVAEIAVNGGAISNVSLDLDISHTWIGDLVITLESPSGTVATVFDGCGNVDNLVATFADGNPAFDCGASAVGNTYSPVDAFSAFNGEMASGTWLLTVDDNVGGDNGTFNSFNLTIDAAGVPVPGGELVDNCSNGEVEYTEVVVQGSCTDPFASQIIRTWTGSDASGNEAEPCVQTITVNRETLATLTLPQNYDGLDGNPGPIECDAAVLDSDEPFHPNGDPNLDAGTYGAPGGVGECGTIITYYEDVVIPICDQTCSYTNNSYKVVRQFTILDWCTGEILTPTQILKVEDTTAPELSGIADMTISTDIWGCGATIDLPAAAATDNCTASEDITYTFSSSAGTQVGNSFVLEDPAKTMPGAPITITVTASDCCGNSSSTDFNVTVVDLVPPVIVAETSRTVSLSTDGVAKAFAEDFDDGSHDGCGPIEFFVRRMDAGGSCSSLDKYGLYAGSENGHEVSANNVDDNKEFNDVVHFCCADVGETIMVQFKVCDDANMDGVVGNSGDNCNVSMVEVEVQDKLAPAIICPEDMTISCIDLAGLGNLQDLSDNFLNEQFGAATAAATCNVTVTQSIVGSSACGAGTVIRNFTATNSIGQTSTCSQFITVTAEVSNTLTCDRINFAELNNNIYDWCDVNDNNNDNDDDLPAITIDCADGLSVPELDIDINGLCTEVGLSIEVDTFNFAGGACKKYLVHYEVIDQCVFEENYVNDQGEVDPYNSENGYFEFFIEVDAFDNEAPTLECEAIDVIAQSCTGFDGAISITGTDNCTDAAYFGFQWRLDVGADDVIDTDWIQSATVTPGALGLSEFPIGDHIIYWLVSDGCGNDATCAQDVSIDVNDKEPTPYCIDGLATAVMPSTGTVELWAEDFDAGSFDNCEGEVTLTMVPESDVDGLSAEAAYSMSTSGWEFDCSYIPNGVSAIIEVRIYVTDADGNWDYCTASLRIDDNFDACPDAGTLTFEVDGELKTQNNDGVNGVDVITDAAFPEFPMTETVDEYYAFDLIQHVDYTITPQKNDNHLNGITTADIVLIQKHILGLQPITSPYTLIAADVNKDCKVNGSDIIQIRKLLLGKYSNDEFPNNTSWRFVESDFAFPNPQAPCEFNEESDIFNLSADETNDFVAIKNGDINQSAEANLTMDAEARSNENMEFVVVDQAVEAGRTYTVPFLAKDFTEVFGFQYTLNLAGANFISVESGALNVNENNFGLRNGGVVVSVDLANGLTLADDAVLFTITVEANTAANLSEIININSTGLTAEAYVGSNLEILGSDVVFRTNEGVVTDADFVLYQNEPNPFNGLTTIGFELPTSGDATITVYDVTGKVLYTRVDGFAKGYNVVTLDRNDIQASGVLYYKLENGDNVATKKMIIIE